MKRTEAVVREHFPMVPGWPETINLYTVEIGAETDRYYLVRKTGLFKFLRHWKWLPKNGTFIKVYKIGQNK
jgi:hypothetical protein